ncbi:hypothetical protein [Cohnella hongkongensis]|uniref:Uncharacterized protein n=1 Tax=Cohnella hongkongensis TaxID=178337 RepID=A0ABV9FEX4_9BACL
MEPDYLRHMDSVDGAGLRMLMDRYGDDVWKYAFVLTRDREQARDTIKSRLYRARKEFREGREHDRIDYFLIDWVLDRPVFVALHYAADSAEIAQPLLLAVAAGIRYVPEP